MYKAGIKILKIFNIHTLISFCRPYLQSGTEQGTMESFTYAVSLARVMFSVLLDSRSE